MSLTQINIPEVRIKYRREVLKQQLTRWKVAFILFVVIALLVLYCSTARVQKAYAESIFKLMAHDKVKPYRDGQI